MTKKNNINLTDYIYERVYSKAESYTKSDIDNLIDAIREREVDIFELVLELPTEDIKQNKVYLVYNGGEDNANLFDVFIHVNGGWEQLDGMDFNISDYYNTNQIDNLLQSKASTLQLNTVRDNLITVRDNLTNLYSNLSDFNEVLVNFDDDNENLSDDLSKLKDNLEIFVDRVNQLIQGVDTLNTTVTDLSTDLEETQSDLISLQEDLTGDEGLSNTLSSLRDDLDTVNDTLTGVQDSISSNQTEINNLKTKDTELTGELGTLSTSLNTNNTTLDSTRTSLTTLRGEFDSAVSELNTATSNISSLESSTESLSNALTGISSDLSSVETSLQSNTTGLQNLQTELLGANGVKQNLTNLTTTVTGVQNELNTTNTNLNSFSNKLNNFLSDLSVLGTALTDFEGSLEDFQTEHEDDLDLITFDLDSKIAELFINIGSVRSDVSSLDDAINNEETGLLKNVNDVNNALYGVDGDAENPSSNSLFGAIDDVYDNIERVDNTIGDNNTGLIHDINASNTRIDNANTNIDAIQTELYGGEGYSFNNPSADSYVDKLNTTHDDLEDAKTVIGDNNTGLIGNINRVEGRLNQSLEYINNVQKIVYGDNTYYYTCGEEWASYTIDTSNITGEQYIKFLVYPVNNILIKDITEISNGDFSNGLTNWNVTDNTNITVETINDETVCRLNSVNHMMILSQEDIDFTNIDNISFCAMALDDNPLVDVINGFFIYIGDEAENQGLLDTLSNFQISLSNLDTGLNNLSDDLTDATTRISQVETDIGDSNSGIIKDINDINTDIGTANTRIDNTLTTIGEVQGDISTVQGEVSDVQEILYGDGDAEHPANNTVLKNISTAQTDINTVQEDITDINTTIGDNNNGLIKDINTANTNINTAQNNISNLEEELYVGENNGTPSDPSDNTVMRDILNINDINQLIQNAIDNLFTPPSVINDKLTYVYIHQNMGSGNPIDTQELLLMEYDYNFPISKTNYIYFYSPNGEGSVYKRVGNNWNAGDWRAIYDEDVETELDGKDLLFVCFRLENSDLDGEIKDAGLGYPLRLNYVYEISTRKYYELGLTEK